MLKAARWLVLSTMLLAGCGLIPTATEPTRPAATPAAGTTDPSKPGTPAGAPSAAPAAASPPAAAKPSPSPSPSPSPIPRTTVRIGTSSSLGGWIIDIADGLGYLAAQGIVLDRKEADPGSAVVAEDIDKRERDVGVVTADRLVQLGKNGQGLIMIAGLVNKATHTLIAARDVPDFAALKGKPVGHLDAKSASAAIVNRILKAKGIPETESPLLTFPDPGVVGAAVANGTVGASLVDPPRAGRLRISGFTALIDAAEVAPDLQAEGIVVRPEWARQNEDLVTRFLRATIMAERWINTPANKPAAVEQLSHSLGITPTEAAMVYEQHVVKLAAIPREGDVDPAGVRGVIDLLGEIDAAGSPRPDPARLTDTTYLQRAKGSMPR
ncbi:MAG TPA: ABC transporter substrate-binding protein [Chloroflexota bacterium]|nr:ABC transporter substrate-binding protein [Chloroflexota bacterium]